MKQEWLYAIVKNSKASIILAFSLKLFYAFLLAWVYTFYYQGGDTFTLGNDALQLANYAWEHSTSYLDFFFTSDPYYHPEQHTEVYAILSTDNPRALFFTKINSLFALVSFNKYWLLCIWISIINFCCVFYLYKIISIYYPKATLATYIALFIWPSIGFWTSGIQKESLLMCFIVLLFSLSIQLYHSIKNYNKLIYFTLSGLILMGILKLKFYYFALLSPFFALLCMEAFLGKYIKKKNIKIGIYLVLFLTIIGISSQLHYHLKFDRILYSIEENAHKIIVQSPEDNLIDYSPLEGSFTNLIKQIPSILIQSTWRPFLWETTTGLKKILQIERFALFILFILVAYKLLKQKGIRIPYLAILCILWILATLSILGFAAPNIGTLARYLAPVQAFLILLLLTVVLPLPYNKRG